MSSVLPPAVASCPESAPENRLGLTSSYPRFLQIFLLTAGRANHHLFDRRPVSTSPFKSSPSARLRTHRITSPTAAAGTSHQLRKPISHTIRGRSSEVPARSHNRHTRGALATPAAQETAHPAINATLLARRCLISTTLSRTQELVDAARPWGIETEIDFSAFKAASADEDRAAQGSHVARWSTSQRCSPGSSPSTSSRSINLRARSCKS